MKCSTVSVVEKYESNLCGRRWFGMRTQNLFTEHRLEDMEHTLPRGLVQCPGFFQSFD